MTQTLPAPLARRMALALACLAPTALALACIAPPALAQTTAPADAPATTAPGDATAGKTTFNKCKSCHSVIAPDGTAIEKGGKTGPNLYGVIGRQVASTDYDYGPSIRAVGETGAIWTKAELASYVANPAEWLKERLDDPAATSKMTFKLPKGGADVAAYLATLAPAPQETPGPTTP